MSIYLINIGSVVKQWEKEHKMTQGSIGDYLLIDEGGKVRGNSSNTDFWDGDDSVVKPANGKYLIVKVIASVVRTSHNETRIAHE